MRTSWKLPTLRCKNASLNNMLLHFGSIHRFPGVVHEPLSSPHPQGLWTQVKRTSGLVLTPSPSLETLLLSPCVLWHWRESKVPSPAQIPFPVLWCSNVWHQQLTCIFLSRGFNCLSKYDFQFNKGWVSKFFPSDLKPILFCSPCSQKKKRENC